MYFINKYFQDSLVSYSSNVLKRKNKCYRSYKKPILFLRPDKRGYDFLLSYQLYCYSSTYASKG